MTNFIRRNFYSRSDPPPVGTVHIGEEQLPVAVDHLSAVEANISFGVLAFDVTMIAAIEAGIGAGVMGVAMTAVTAAELDRGALYALPVAAIVAQELDAGALAAFPVAMIASTEVDLGALAAASALPIVAIEADRGAVHPVGFRRYSRIDGSMPDTPLPDIPWTEMVAKTGIFSHEET